MPDLRALLRRLVFKVVFLSEAKKGKAEMDGLLSELGDFFGLLVDARGRGGGLALLWDKKVDVSLISCSSHHIDVSVRWEEEKQSWRFFGIYGWADLHLKWKIGALVVDLKPRSCLPWLIRDDLNEMFYHCENVCEPPKHQNAIENFLDNFIENGLFNLGYSGYNFTSCNYQQNSVVVEDKLDHFCVDSDWSSLFPDACISHIDSDILDHLPIC